MTPVIIPMSVIATCPPSTRSASRTKRGGPLRSATRRPLRYGVERVAARLEHRSPEPADVSPPELGDPRLEGITFRAEPLHLDGDVRGAEAAYDVGERRRRLQR